MVNYLIGGAAVEADCSPRLAIAIVKSGSRVGFAEGVVTDASRSRRCDGHQHNC